MIQEGEGRLPDTWSTPKEWPSQSMAPANPGQISVLWGVKRTELLLCFCWDSLMYDSGQTKLGFLCPDLAGEIGTSLACRSGRSGTKIPRPARSTCLGSGVKLKAVIVLDHNLGTLVFYCYQHSDVHKLGKRPINITASFRRRATR